MMLNLPRSKQLKQIIVSGRPCETAIARIFHQYSTDHDVYEKLDMPILQPSRDHASRG